MAKIYESKLFESKHTKRGLHEAVTSQILEFGDKGCVVSLCGPAVEPHYRDMRCLLRKDSQLLMAEWNEGVVREERLRDRIKALGDSRVVFYEGDVWQAITKLYIRKKGWDHKHVLFDLDFCCTAETAIAQGLYMNLKRLALSKLPRKTGFWIVITFCRRGDRYGEWQDVISKVIRTFSRAGWQMSFNENIPYAERGALSHKRKGANMVMLKFRFHWDYNLSRK